MLDIIRAVLKFLGFSATMMCFILHHTVLTLVMRDQEKKHRLFLKNICRYAALVKYLLNIKVYQRGNSSEVKGSLIVANHMSYVDVLILAVLYPSLFVTSVEIKEVPILGQMTQLAGCFFVERRRSKITPGTKAQELGLMKEKLSQGFNVFLFPEGTSSDGSRVLPFKVTFFQLAVDTGAPVVPVCLKYQGLSKSVVPWYGDMTFPGHLFRICLLPEISAELIELESFTGLDKIEISQKAFQEISLVYG